MREEILVRMGLDQKPLIGGLNTVSQRMTTWASREGSKIGNMFAGNFRAVFGAFTAGGLFRSLRSTGEEINRLKDDAEALKEKFGDLSASQIDYAISVSQNMAETERAVDSFKGKLVFGTQLLVELFGSAIASGKSLAETWRDMVDQAVQKTKDLEELQGVKAWEKRKQALLKFAFAREAADLRHMSHANQIAHWERKIVELHALASKEGTNEEVRLEFAQQILAVEQKIADIHAKPPDDDWSNRNLPRGEIGAWPAGKIFPEYFQKPAPPLSPLREQLARQFGDPMLPGYRDPKGGGSNNGELLAQIEAVLRKGITVYPGDDEPASKTKGTASK